MSESSLSPQEMGDMLRDVEFAMIKARAALVAFVAPQYIERIKRDHDRLSEALAEVKAALPHFPPAEPLTAEQEAEAAYWIGRALSRLDPVEEDRHG